MNKSELKKRIFEIDFVIYDLVLYLDTHPTCKKAMELLEEYRKKRKEIVLLYENNFGKFIGSINDVPANDCWQWLSSPWPWDNDFLEG